MSRILTVAALLLLSACAAAPAATGPTRETPARSLADHDPAWDRDPALCRSAGGTISRVGMAGMPYCVIPTTDGGKVCRDKADCQGKCILFEVGKTGRPAQGVCQRQNVQFGCFSEVRGGRAQPALCVD